LPQGQTDPLPAAARVIAQTTFVEFKNSAIHGTGGFARTHIASGNQVIEYVGEKIDKTESMRRCENNNEFIFALNPENHIDGSVDWNLARWINHSCDPNCEALIDGQRVWLTALRPIAAGEEITFNYGFDLEDYREYSCRCGSPNCVGFIVAEEFFDHVRRQNALCAQAAQPPL